MAVTGCCGGECGVQGVRTHWPNINGVGTLTFETGSPRTGARHIRFAGTAGSVCWSSQVAGGNLDATARIVIARFYIRFPSSLPSKDCLFTDIFNAAVNVIVGVGFNQASSTIECFTATTANGALSFAGGGFTVVADTWYRIDLRLRSDGDPWTADAMVNGTAVTSASLAGTAANLGGCALGVYGEGGTGAITIDFDDVVFSQTIGDYPVGPGYVAHFVPTSDGTHNIAGADDFERSATGTDITNATTTAYQLVDDVPLETVETDYIRLIAPANATDYVEVVYGPASGVSTPVHAPRTASILVGHHSAGTLANNLRVALLDANGGTQADVFSKDISDTAMAYSGAAFNTIPGGGAWTVTAFNNLRTRMYTSDANPDPYVDGLMIEAEFAVTVALTGTATASISETDIVAGGKTLIATLTGDTWIAAGVGSFDLQRDEIIAGFDSAQSELLGWDNVVKALQAVTGVVRTSDTVVTLTLDAQATYDITAQETITDTVPSTALTRGESLIATPTFTVSATGGTVRLLASLGVGT